jgi:hypothetical protein
MASEAARAVAQEVIKTVEAGGRPVITSIAPKKGYSRRTADSGKIQKTKSYQAAIAPLVQRLEKERDAVIKRMRAVRNKAKYRDLVDSVDKLTKNIQLLSGKATENVAVGVKHLTDAQLAELADGGQG